MKIATTVIVVLFTITLFTNCVKPDGCYREYKLLFPATVSPSLDTFNIGDTIWYEVKIDDVMEDHNTGEQINTTSLDLLYFNFYFQRFDTIHYDQHGSDFEYFASNGELQRTASGGNLILKQPERLFKMFILPKKKGGYVISSWIPLYFKENAVDLGDPCYEDIWRKSSVRPNNENNNLSVLEGRYTIVQLQQGKIDTVFFNDEKDWWENGYYAFWVM